MAAKQELTRNQDLVLAALGASDGPLSAYTILDKVRGDGVRAPLQVYRALDKLVALGLVHRLESLNAFVACAHRHETEAPHSHGLIAFAICGDCGQVDEFSDTVVETRLKDWAGSHGFKRDKTVIEMRGTCATCLAH